MEWRRICIRDDKIEGHRPAGLCFLFLEMLFWCGARELHECDA